MTGKYKNQIHYILALIYRSIIRVIIRSLMAWDKSNQNLQNGCTVIIGMCSKLPGVLHGNLLGLRLAQWQDLKEIIIVVDNAGGNASRLFEQKILKDFEDLNIRFIHYTYFQSLIADLLKLPYIYSWLSWVMAINVCQTKSFFIHDYDALILGDFLKDRYRMFITGKKIIQGIYYYRTNGIIPEDKLVCTFEAFVDTQWVKSYSPVSMFNKLGFINGRSVDFDTLLYMQQHGTSAFQREIIPMSEEELLHPAQMIHQYTVFQKYPKRPWNCAALVMIPFFLSLQEPTIFEKTVRRIQLSGDKVIDLLGDGCLMNFLTLRFQHLDKMLRLMVQGYIKFNIKPSIDFYSYGTAFYDLVGLPESERWKMYETKEQKQWVEELKLLKV
jgi:hypothetical protein